jgi:hypothetical protein
MFFAIDQSNWLIAKKKEGLKLQQKKNPGSWIWELEVEWGTSFLKII